MKEFLTEIKEYKGKNVMSRSYELLNVYFKDLTDNDVFYNLIKEYFYANDAEGFKETYESYNSNLKYGMLKAAAEYLVKDVSDVSCVAYYGKVIKQQADIFNKATHFAPEQKILILV